MTTSFLRRRRTWASTEGDASDSAGGVASTRTAAPPGPTRAGGGACAPRSKLSALRTARHLPSGPGQGQCRSPAPGLGVGPCRVLILYGSNTRSLARRPEVGAQGSLWSRPARGGLRPWCGRLGWARVVRLHHLNEGRGRRCCGPSRRPTRPRASSCPPRSTPGPLRGARRPRGRCGALPNQGAPCEIAHVRSGLGPLFLAERGGVAASCSVVDDHCCEEQHPAGNDRNPHERQPTGYCL